MFRSTSGTRRVLLALCALLLSLVFVLPKQSRTLLQAVGKPLADVVAPPYDVIDASRRRELLARSPFNVVEIDLPEAPADRDRSA